MVGRIIILVFIVSMEFSMPVYSQHYKHDEGSKKAYYDTVINHNGDRIDYFNKALAIASKGFQFTKMAVEQADKEETSVFLYVEREQDYRDSIQTKKKSEAFTQTTNIKFKARIYCKDNKVKVVLDNITNSIPIINSDVPFDAIQERTLSALYNATDKSIRKFLDEFSKSITGKSESEF